MAVNGYMLDEVLQKIKEMIRIKNFDKTKILIETDDISLKNVVISISFVVKDDDIFFPETLVA